MSGLPATRARLSSLDVRDQIVRALRRDLIGPGESDDDIAQEMLSEAPSRWYLTGFLAPAEEHEGEDEAAAQQEDLAIGAEEPDPLEAGVGAAADDVQTEAPVARRRFLPSSIGITALVPPSVNEIEAIVSWADYRTVPPLTAEFLRSEDEPDGQRRPAELPEVNWERAPQQRVVRLRLVEGRATPVLVPESSTPQLPGGGLQLEVHTRSYSLDTPEGGQERGKAVTVFLVNRRSAARRRRYADVTYIFQARIDLVCEAGFMPRRDLSGWRSTDEDVRLADLHYRDVSEYAVGRNVAADCHLDAENRVLRVWTEAMPTAEVERVAPNEAIPGERNMEHLAALTRGGADVLAAQLTPVVDAYAAWIAGQERQASAIAAPRRRETALALVARMRAALARIADGIELLRRNESARLAFRFMNEAVARAARRRDPNQRDPQWRPFQLAFILLNLVGLTEKSHPDREIVDLLFFPTGGGKTEAYLGLAAYSIAHRRITGHGVLGAGVSVIMRYTLRLLTLDQLSRAAGVVCALELARSDLANVDANGRRLLGDWPIEIGLWVGSDASPNRLGGTGDTGDETAVTRVRKYQNGRTNRAPAPIKECPWCRAPFTRQSFSCVPNMRAPINLEIRCTNPDCDFTGDRPLPVLTVDEPIYRRLPAFLIATVDKFASLPWLGQAGAFFNHVDRFDPARGFFGASETGGRPFDNGWKLDPPDLIIQDELHLISGPLGTIAGLYETAIDELSARSVGDRGVRPKIVASTATVRRAADQIRALFGRAETHIFPAPGVDRRDSFFAVTRPSSEEPARLYLGLAAQGRGPKLVFLRALTTLTTAAQAIYEEAGGGDGNPADPYMTALCYFNALRELGGARRIVEDEVRAGARYRGDARRRLLPNDRPFANRIIREPLELTSRVSTDDVARAKRELEQSVTRETGVDIALATNMISVGLDITRLGLMIVQSQPKTAAEYIQATSRVGRDLRRPGLVVTILNLHKPRDRMHFEQFGHFHRTFYRAVEATSVTPWAARALDRALAAVVVTLARHIDPSLSPNPNAHDIVRRPETRTRVRNAILARAGQGPDSALARQIDATFDDWVTTANAQRINGGRFGYAEFPQAQRLLIAPLDPAMMNLDPSHRRFVAARSMRDVEANAALYVMDPSGRRIEQADDIS